MNRSMASAVLDNWRSTVVPILWSVFWAGALLGLSNYLESSALSGVPGLDRSVKYSMRQDLEIQYPKGLDKFDAWAATVPPGSVGDFKEQSRSVMAYFRFDRESRKVLGSPEASDLLRRASRIRKRFMPGVMAFFSLLALMVFWTAEFFQRDRRLWRSCSYFASRAFVAFSYFRAMLLIIGAFGDVWLTGSAASHLTSLPVPVSLWTVMLASPILVSAVLDLLVVYCLSSILSVVNPDP